MNPPLQLAHQAAEYASVLQRLSRWLWTLQENVSGGPGECKASNSDNELQTECIILQSLTQLPAFLECWNLHEEIMKILFYFFAYSKLKL